MSIAFNSSAIYVGQAVGTSVAAGILTALPGNPGYLALAWGACALLVLGMLLSLVASWGGGVNSWEELSSPLARFFSLSRSAGEGRGEGRPQSQLCP